MQGCDSKLSTFRNTKMGDSPQVYCVCRSAEVDRFMM